MSALGFEPERTNRRETPWLHGGETSEFFVLSRWAVVKIDAARRLG